VTVKYGVKERSLPRMESAEFILPLGQMENEIGVVIGFNNVILLANKMGYEAALVGRKIHFKVPPYRLDVINEQDIVEDIAIAYGYDFIQPVPLPATQVGSAGGVVKSETNIEDAMLGMGFYQTFNSYLTNEEYNFKKMRESQTDHYVTIANAKTETITMMRTWLLPGLLKELGQSMHDKMPLKLFELDTCFDVRDGRPDESRHLAAVACYSQANFNDIKAVFEGLAKRTGMDCTIEKGENKSFIEGRCATVVVHKRVIGFLGEIHPEVLTSFGVEEPVVGFEIDLTGWLYGAHVESSAEVGRDASR